jgi:hypothetical protein
MTGEKVDFQEAVEGMAPRKNERSSIDFPYLDLDSAVDVAKSLYRCAGHGGCEMDVLAAEMKQTVSGAFRLKTGNARMFGFIEKDTKSGNKLSALGVQVTNGETEARAKAEAFLKIPLYEAIFQKYRGHLLPPAKALEREMAQLGVAPKQADKARQVFERSARQSGFFSQGEDRLIQPRFDPLPATKPIVPPADEGQKPLKNGNGGGDGDGGNSGKPLKYQLIDLLELGEMDESEQQAVWTILNFLAKVKTKSAAKKSAAEMME